MVVTPGQVRAARGFVNWSARDLADAGGIGLSTVQRFEGGGTVTAANLSAIRTALERAGVEFTNGGQPGVRMKGRPPRPTED